MLEAQDKDQLFLSQWYKLNIHKMSPTINSLQQYQRLGHLLVVNRHYYRLDNNTGGEKH